jgi:FHS family L-fucose permease-like MFS transporter
MLILVSCLVIFVYGLLSSLLGTVIPGLADSLHLTNADIGYIGLAQGFGLAGMSAVSGALMDRKGKKIGVIVGLCATIAGLLLIVNATSMAAVAVAMLILGCGGSIVIVGANAITSDVSDKRRAAALNFLNVFSGLGGLITPFVAGNLLGSKAGNTAIFGAVATLLVLGVVIVTPIPNSRHPSVQEVQRSKSVFAGPALYILSVVTLLYTACEFGIWNWLPKYLISTGMSSVAALNILSLGFACGLLFGRVVATSVLWRIPPFVVVLFCSTAMICTTYMILRPMSQWLTGTVVFLTGMAMAPVFPTTIAMVGKLFKKQSGTAIGFAITCGFSGFMLSSPIIGWLSGPDPAGIGHGLLLLPVLSCTITVIFLASRNLLQKEEARREAMAGVLAQS